MGSYRCTVILELGISCLDFMNQSTLSPARIGSAIMIGSLELELFSDAKMGLERACVMTLSFPNMCVGPVSQPWPVTSSPEVLNSSKNL